MRFSSRTAEYSSAEGEAQRRPTVKQMDIKAKESGISHIMISQGRINKYGLRLKNTDKKRYYTNLQLPEFKSEDVFLMTIDDDGKTQIIRKKDLI